MSEAHRAPDEFHYRIGWRAGGLVPGHHRGSQPGVGLEYRHHAPLEAAPDVRRLDLRASLRDPLARWLARVPHQRSAISVTLIADLSASMGYTGRARKLDLLADFTASAGRSAFRTGDRFAFFGGDATLLGAFTLPSTRAQGAALELAARLRDFVPSGNGAAGLLDAARHVAGRRGLVFLVSDFHFPLALLERVLASLQRHQAVPVVLWDPAEEEQFARVGLAWVNDPESGGRRLLFGRPGLAARVRARYRARRASLEGTFRAHGLRPLYLDGVFNAETVTRYFLQETGTRLGEGTS